MGLKQYEYKVKIDWAFGGICSAFAMFVLIMKAEKVERDILLLDLKRN